MKSELRRSEVPMNAEPHINVRVTRRFRASPERVFPLG